jgi:hypothetical protein
MIAKSTISKLAFPFLLGAILIAAGFSSASAELFLSTDIPVNVGSNSYEERDIISYESSNFSTHLSGSSLGIPLGANIDAFDFSGSSVIFSVDIPITLGGANYSEQDIISYDGSSFSKLLDGAALGIPDGTHVDAANVLSGGSIVFSLDTPISLGGNSFKPHDLIKYDGSAFSFYFDGSANGIPQGADIDGAYVSPDGNLLFSLDVPTELGGLKVRDKDIIRWDGTSFSLHFDGLSAGLPEGADLDAVSQKIPVVSGSIDIDPGTLNLKGGGKWVTCYIEPPGGCMPENIDLSSVAITKLRINGSPVVPVSPPIKAESKPTGIGDYDGDIVPDLMVKFSRPDLKAAIGEPGVVEVTVDGNCNGTPFSGTDTIQVIKLLSTDTEGQRSIRFSAGEEAYIKCKFGVAEPCFVKGIVKLIDKSSGTVIGTFKKNKTVNSGTNTLRCRVKLPSGLQPGTKVKAKLKLKRFDQKGGKLLGVDKGMVVLVIE